MFRVTYYKCRINLEVFHVLTDGMGGLNFLKELTYQYLRLTHPRLREQDPDIKPVNLSQYHVQCLLQRIPDDRFF